MSSIDCNTNFFTLFSQADLLSLNSLAASTFAGESTLGSFNIEITDTNICSTPKTGLHFSSSRSCSLYISLPGLCKILIQTLPSSNTIN